MRPRAGHMRRKKKRDEEKGRTEVEALPPSRLHRRPHRGLPRISAAVNRCLLESCAALHGGNDCVVGINSSAAAISNDDGLTSLPDEVLPLSPVSHLHQPGMHPSPTIPLSRTSFTTSPSSKLSLTTPATTSLNAAFQHANEALALARSFHPHSGAAELEARAQLARGSSLHRMVLVMAEAGVDGRE